MKLKKLSALLLALCLLVCAGAACAETVVNSVFTLTDVNVELNRTTNTLIVRNPETRNYYVADLSLNPLSEEYPRLSSKDYGFEIIVDNFEHGLLDGQGKVLIPPEYADIAVFSERWAAGIRLVESTADNYDYKTFLSSEQKFFLVDTVDIYYMGEKKATLTRDAWASNYSVKAFGDYLYIQNRDGTYAFYNKEMEKSAVEANSGYSEYDYNYSARAYTHLGSGQTAFVPECTLSAEEVQQAFIVNNEKQLVDLQGNVLADLSAYASTSYRPGSTLITVRNEEGKYGLVSFSGAEVVPCRYDSLDYDTASAEKIGWISAERDGKSGFVSIGDGTETGFTYAESAVTERAAFSMVDSLEGGKILLSAMAGEIGTFDDASAGYSGSASKFAVVKLSDGTCKIIGQLGEDVLPDSPNFTSIYSPTISDDGSLILLRTDDTSEYKLYKVESYDPDLSAVPAPAAPEEAETWTCSNGHTGLTTNFCPDCGEKRPE